jgi:hypothetical protein
MAGKSPLKIIREHCLDCSNGQYSEVENCPCDKCKLWPYRFGKNPFREPKKLTDEQRQKIRERLSRKQTIVL